MASAQTSNLKPVGSGMSWADRASAPLPKFRTAMPLPIIVLGLKVHFTRILLRAVEGGLPRRKIEKREINKEGLWGVPSNSGIAVRNFPQI